jgi:predicted anti-sigma-YlaC factor YlaD
MLFQKLSFQELSFHELQWMFPIAVGVHNSEEAVFFPPWWIAHAAQLPVHPNPEAARWALLALTMAAFAVTYFSWRKGKQSVGAYLQFGGIVTMLANVLIPHVPATLVWRGYTPGVVTAILINFPVMSWLGVRAVREGWVSGRKAVAYAVAVPLAVAAVIPMLLLIPMLIRCSSRCFGR